MWAFTGSWGIQIPTCFLPYRGHGFTQLCYGAIHPEKILCFNPGYMSFMMWLVHYRGLKLCGSTSRFRQWLSSCARGTFQTLDHLFEQIQKKPLNISRPPPFLAFHSVVVCDWLLGCSLLPRWMAHPLPALHYQHANQDYC